MRCDLHVHSLWSGRADIPLLSHLGNESYSTPRAIYERCHAVGMDLVTITDHDTIEGALEIAGLPGTFVSEEVTVHLPAQRHLHLGVLDIDERQHARITDLRPDAEAFFAYCAEQDIPVCVNHPFSASTGARLTTDFQSAMRGGVLVETRNGMMPREANLYAEWAAEMTGLTGIAGSDAHTLTSIGRAYTQVPGASSKAEFLEGLRRGSAIPRGRCGSYARLTADVMRIFGLAYATNLRQAHRSVTAALRLAGLLVIGPGLLLIPLITAVQCGRDRFFAAAHFARFRAAAGSTVRPWRPRAGAAVGASAPAGAVG
jgi:predicted metal-dependent phosphoesterase TrpH